MKGQLVNKCALCKHLNKTIDNRNWVHYTCEYAPNIEWLGSVGRDPLREGCLHFVQKTVKKPLLFK